MPADRDLPDTQYEQDFAEAISRAGEVFHAETTPLVDSGWAYGRRLRRRRRASVLAGAAALALIGVGGVAASGAVGGSGKAGPASAGDPSAAQVSGQEFLAMLTELLPAGATEVGEARGTENDIPQLRLTLDDGHGAVQYLLWIARLAGVSADRGCPAQLGGDACTASTLADGSELVVYQAGTRDNEPAGSKMWSANLYAKDGYQVQLREWNRKPLENGSPITRADPPLSPTQLAAVAADPRWKRVADALPKDGRLRNGILNGTPVADLRAAIESAAAAQSGKPQSGPVTFPAVAPTASVGPTSEASPSPHG
ncbi:hypothetical protein OG535_17270 [Kitasatospora sp. NBC_00085]|uniref:hypothetical protein n=1 Tax=unclassified Kitasatospora TaxID=2633591 RepID=UPI003250DD1B